MTAINTENYLISLGLLQYPSFMGTTVKAYSRPYYDGLIYVHQVTDAVTFGDSYDDSRPLDLQTCLFNLHILVPIKREKIQL